MIKKIGICLCSLAVFATQASQPPQFIKAPQPSSAVSAVKAVSGQDDPVVVPRVAATHIPLSFRSIITGRRAIDQNTLIELAKGAASVRDNHEFEEVILIIEKNPEIYKQHPEWLNTQNEQGDTILHILVKKYIGSSTIYDHDIRAFAALLAQGVDYTIRNNDGETVEDLTRKAPFLRDILVAHRHKQKAPSPAAIEQRAQSANPASGPIVVVPRRITSPVDSNLSSDDDLSESDEAVPNPSDSSPSAIPLVVASSRVSLPAAQPTQAQRTAIARQSQPQPSGLPGRPASASATPLLGSVVALPTRRTSSTGSSPSSFLTPAKVVGLGAMALLAAVIGKYYYDHKKAQQISAA